jgi:DNA-binding NtrC family response regulator
MLEKSPKSGAPLRVLHLEENPADAALVAETLRAGGIVCDVIHVHKRASFEAALEHDRFDVILADYQLSSFDGITAQAIAADRRPDAPFIFVSGIVGEDIAVERLKSGAADFVLKQKLARLPWAIRRAIRESEAAARRTRAEAQMRRLNAELEQRVMEQTRQLVDARRLVEARESELREAKSLLAQRAGRAAQNVSEAS